MGKEERDKVMEIMPYYERKGMEKGIEKGMEKGIEIGETKALKNTAMLQLTHKFGELPDEIKNAISHASKETSQNILLNIFSIESIDDIRHYFNKY